MRILSKIVSGVLVGATLLAGVSSASADPYHRHRYPHRFARHQGFTGTDALVLGAVGALAVGAIIASQQHDQPAYYAGNDYPDSAYPPVGYRPSYSRGSYDDGAYDDGIRTFAPRHYHHTREVLWDSERAQMRGY